MTTTPPPPPPPIDKSARRRRLSAILDWMLDMLRTCAWVMALLLLALAAGALTVIAEELTELVHIQEHLWSEHHG